MTAGVVDIRAAQDRVKTLALSLFAVHGFPAPSGERLGTIVERAMASMGRNELRRPENISLASLGQLDGLVRGSVEAGKPYNIHGAEAARAAQAPGTHGGPHGGHGFDRYDGQRGSSARFREIGGSGDGKGISGSGSGGSGGSVSAPANGMVTPAYARSFADTGVSGGTLKTFAEVGMDRGIFNQFRHEGFSKAQIVDSAQDSKVLHFKGKEDLSAAQHAPVDLRKAAVKVEQAKTPEEKEKAKAHEAGTARKYEALPDSDPRKQRARDFIQRLEKHGHHVELGAGMPGTRAKQDDASLAKDNGKIAPAAQKGAQDGTMAKGDRKKTAALSSGADDAFGSSAPSPSAPTKPVPVRTATAKPAAPTVG